MTRHINNTAETNQIKKQNRNKTKTFKSIYLFIYLFRRIYLFADIFSLIPVNCYE